MKNTILTCIILIVLINYYFMSEFHKRWKEQHPVVNTLTLCSLHKEEVIEAIQLVVKGETFQLENRQEFWRIIDPVLEMADPMIVGGMEQVLRLARKERVLSAVSDDLAEYGLVEPDIRVGILTTERGYRYLTFGKQVPLASSYYAKWSDSNDIFIVTANIRNSFNKTLFSVRKRSIFDLSVKDNLTKVSFVLGPYSMKMHYEDALLQWRIDEPFLELADIEVMNGCIQDIKGIYVQSFLDGQDYLDERFGLNNSKEYIRFVTAKDKEIVLTIGAFSEEEKGYYAHTAGHAMPIIIAQDAIDVLKKDPNDFIERRIILFDHDAVGEFIYEKGDRKDTIVHHRERWHLRNTEATFETEMAINELLQYIGNIRYLLILNAAGVKRMGFKPDDHLFDLTIRSENTGTGFFEYPLRFFSKADGYFINNAQDGNYYEIEEADYAKLMALIDKIYE